MDEWKRSGQIPAFGNWDMANDLPITQYFECARQAGLVRFSSSSGESGDRDLYTPDSNKHVPVSNRKKNSNNPYSNHKHKQATRNRERRCQHGGAVVNKEKEKGNNNNNNNNNNVNVVARKQGRVYDVVLDQPRKPVRVISSSKQLNQDDTVPRTPPRRAPKPVDEDLYKIPHELLHTTKRKRKKMLGFISKCLVPAACVS